MKPENKEAVTVVTKQYFIRPLVFRLQLTFNNYSVIAIINFNQIKAFIYRIAGKHIISDDTKCIQIAQMFQISEVVQRDSAKLFAGVAEAAQSPF